MGTLDPKSGRHSGSTTTTTRDQSTKMPLKMGKMANDNTKKIARDERTFQIDAVLVGHPHQVHPAFGRGLLQPVLVFPRYLHTGVLRHRRQDTKLERSFSSRETRIAYQYNFCVRCRAAYFAAVACE